jgi:dihydrofolate reductase
MRKLIMWNVVTLDGFFEGEKPWDLSFHTLVWGPELEALSLEQLHEADMLVFGEKTYRGMADYWPNAEESDPKVATIMNKIAKVVCSPTLETAEWNNTTIVRDAVKELSRMKQEGDGPMYIFGSADLCESLMKAGLLDEMRLCVAPIILGRGRRLFADQTITSKLGLLEVRSLSSGGVVLKYKFDSAN